MEIYDFLKSSRAYNLFLKDINNNTVTHSNIIYGKDKLTIQKLSLLYACALLCQSSLKPCLKCGVCNRVLKGLHPDCLVYPLKGEKVLTEDIDSLTENSIMRPCEGDIKVYIILNGETMNIAAQNKLLKTLEEPDSPVYIFITANNIESLLPTVKSRCRLYETEMFSAESIFNLLDKEKDIKAAKIASVSCGGLIGKAIEMTKNEQYLKIYNFVYNLFNRLKTYDDVTECMLVINESKDKQEVLDIMQLYFRDCLMFKSGFNNLITGAKDYFNNNTVRYGLKSLIDFIEKTAEAKRKLLLNCNAAPVFETLFNDIVKSRNNI